MKIVFEKKVYDFTGGIQKTEGEYLYVCTDKELLGMHFRYGEGKKAPDETPGGIQYETE